MAIDVQRLSFSYGRAPVLCEISALAAAGRITALIGPNAAGKSTLLRCIIGAAVPQSGQVLIDGEPAHQLTPRQTARKIAYVPQRSIVSAAFNVRQLVELGRYALPPSDARVNDALQRLDLIDVGDRPYPKLSVGQQQRVTLARAIAQLEPCGHLILDEPTSAMDLRHVGECTKLLREIAKGGATVILAMHDLGLASSIADDAWVLHDGRLVAAGPVTDVLTVARLQEVFGVNFEWVQDSRGARRLLPHSLLAAGV